MVKLRGGSQRKLRTDTCYKGTESKQAGTSQQNHRPYIRGICILSVTILFSLVVCEKMYSSSVCLTFNQVGSAHFYLTRKRRAWSCSECTKMACQKEHSFQKRSGTEACSDRRRLPRCNDEFILNLPGVSCVPERKIWHCPSYYSMVWILLLDISDTIQWPREWPAAQILLEMF